MKATLMCVGFSILTSIYCDAQTMLSFTLPNASRIAPGVAPGVYNYGNQTKTVIWSYDQSNWGTYSVAPGTCYQFSFPATSVIFLWEDGTSNAVTYPVLSSSMACILSSSWGKLAEGSAVPFLSGLPASTNVHFAHISAATSQSALTALGSVPANSSGLVNIPVASMLYDVDSFFGYYDSAISAYIFFASFKVVQSSLNQLVVQPGFSSSLVRANPDSVVFSNPIPPMFSRTVGIHYVDTGGAQYCSFTINGQDSYTWEVPAVALLGINAYTYVWNAISSCWVYEGSFIVV